MERFKLIPEAHVILQDENQIFLLRRFNTGYADGQYALIAGHIDGGEPAHIAACREAKEEAGIIIAPEDLRCVHVMHYYLDDIIPGEEERIAFVFQAGHWTGTPHNAEPERCDGTGWFPTDNLPKNLAKHTSSLLAGAFGPEPYSALGWSDFVKG